MFRTFIVTVHRWKNGAAAVMIRDRKGSEGRSTSNGEGEYQTPVIPWEKIKYII